MLVRLLRWLSDASCANAIVGDLDEERARRTRVSTLTATVWFWRSGIGIAVYFAARRIADAVSAGARAITGWSNTPQELGQSVRALRRTPWYSATVVGVIALTM
ncbi:MAG TPA: hypothetical protein VFO19_19830, partial [Vicinamibacterales bacterium]|nr:hypothetical protein [Vicinamibacterales bacterium]